MDKEAKDSHLSSARTHILLFPPSQPDFEQVPGARPSKQKAAGAKKAHRKQCALPWPGLSGQLRQSAQALGLQVFVAALVGYVLVAQLAHDLLGLAGAAAAAAIQMHGGIFVGHGGLNALGKLL